MQKYLQGSTPGEQKASTHITLSPLGEVGYEGSKRPGVVWTNLNETVGLDNGCFKAVHGCSSHELEQLPYSSGLIKMKPTRPRTIHDGDQLTHVLGLRESNEHILHRIQSLDMSHHKVQVLPERIVMMKNLKQLNASSNCLSTLPAGIRTLTNLTHLDLSQNPALFPDIPHSVLSLTKLRELRLANTGLLRLTGSISVLQTLALLDISLNQVLSLPKKELAYMTNLSMLSCNCNPEVDDRICGIPKEVVRRPGMTTLVRDGDKHSNIPLSDSWNWSPDGVLGFLRHRPHMFVPIRKEDGQPQSGGWTRSSNRTCLGLYGIDRTTELIDELLRLVIFLRRYPFPSTPGGPELAFIEVKENTPEAESSQKDGAKPKGKKRRKKGKEKTKIPVERYYVAERIHDIWEQFQIDYARQQKNKPGEECVFFKYLVMAMNSTTLVSAHMTDLQRLLKTYKKKSAKDGFPFPPNFLDGLSPHKFPLGRNKKAANMSASSHSSRQTSALTLTSGDRMLETREYDPFFIFMLLQNPASRPQCCLLKESIAFVHH